MNDAPRRPVALVTGASRGIGAATVRALANEFDVVAAARDVAALKALAAETGATPMAFDATRDVDIDALGDLDIDAAVLNQGIITSARPFHEQGRDEIDRQIAVNLRASMAAARVLLPAMIARGSGHLVFLTSLMARHPFANAAIYGATKAGLHGFAQALRVDLAGTGVRVSEISPGRVETDIWNEALGGDTAAIRDNIFGPYRALTPAEVAATIRAVMTLPPHVDANLVELSPTDQAVGGAVFAKRRQTAAGGGAA
ncbi:MAG: SDR family oxidoreductase [Acuticoccus sp.]